LCGQFRNSLVHNLFKFFDSHSRMMNEGSGSAALILFLAKGLCVFAFCVVPALAF
jgi:hypothetical protein